MDAMTRTLLLHQIFCNPLPWRVEHDWTNEVHASNGVIIAKCHTRDEAEGIIKAAEALADELQSYSENPTE